MLSLSKMSEVFKAVIDAKTPLAITGVTILVLCLIYGSSLKTSSANAGELIIKKQIVTLVFVLALIAMLLGFAGFVIELFFKHKITDPDPRLLKIVVSGKAYDRTNNPTSGVSAYAILNGDTCYSNPLTTGSDGQFTITFDTTENFSDIIYFRKGTAQPDKKKFNSMDFVELTVSPRVDVIPISYQFTIQQPIKTALVKKLRKGVLGAAPPAQDWNIRFDYDPSKKVLAYGNMYKYNYNGHVRVYLNENLCYEIPEEIEPSPSTALTKEQIDEYLNRQINNVVERSLNSVVKQLKQCAQ